MSAIFAREIGPEAVESKTLSQVGRVIHQAITKLVQEKGEWDDLGVTLIATEVLGLDKGRHTEYMAAVAKAKSPSASVVHNLLRDRSTLLALTNEISHQLTTGDLDVAKLQTHFSQQGIQTDLTTVADDLEGGVPEPPSGPSILTMPTLSKVTNGVYGVYIIAGVPGVGKSTLASQIVADVATRQPVVVYDIENGRMVLLYRMAQAWGADKARKLGKRMYIREGLRTLSKDLSIIKPPATILVDSIQKINSKGGDDRRAGLDDWIHHFEELKRRGYNVVLVSEINRQSYTGDPKLDCFKETGALEYAADSAHVLQEADGGMLRIFVVKNRHYEFKGQLPTMIERDKENPMRFREINVGWGVG
jgi:Mrp family chromosome partitioning ATPase